MLRHKRQRLSSCSLWSGVQEPWFHGRDFALYSSSVISFCQNLFHVKLPIYKTRHEPWKVVPTVELVNRWIRLFLALIGRVHLKCDGTRWRTGEEVKEKLANEVGSQYPSHYLGTWCIQHYYRWCAHLGCQQSTELTSPADLNRLIRFAERRNLVSAHVPSRFERLAVIGRVQLKCDGTRWRTGGEVKRELGNGVGSRYPSLCLGTCCIQHYYRWYAHLGCQ